MAKDALLLGAEKLFGLIAAGKEPIAEALLSLPELSYKQRHYLWKTIKRYEFNLSMVGLKAPPEPMPPIVLPSEPHFVDFIQGKFILRLGEKHASRIHTVPKTKFDRKTGLYTVPYRMVPVLELHKFVKKTELYYTDAAKEAILSMYVEMRARYKASMAHDADIDMKGFGLALDPFQRAGIKGMLRSGRGFIADEMGLGKTRQGLGTLWLAASFPAVVICPASLPINWEQEALEGLVGKRIWRAKKKTMPNHTCVQRQLSLLDMTSFDASCNACQFQQADLIIVNFDKLPDGWKVQFDESGKKIKGKKRQKGERAEVQLSSLATAIKNRGIQGIIIDESYYIKNEGSQRTKAVSELAPGAKIRIALSGTPIKSRPSELVAQLKVLDRLDDLGGEDVFYRSYCEAASGDTKGASQEGQLNKMLRAIGFIQRSKRDVRKELPPIREGVVWVEIDNREEYHRVETDLINWCAEQAVLKEEFLKMLKNLPVDQQAAAIDRKMIETRMRTMRAAAMIKVGALKRVTAKGKLAAVIDWTRDFLETEKKLVLFAHHRNIQQTIGQTFNSLHIYGSDDINSRQKHKEIFMGERGNFDGLNAQLIVCSFGAAREGINLDAADDIVLVEPQWTPAEEMQAVARIDRHRVHNINAYRLVAVDTIEVKINKLLEKKRKIVDAVTKGEIDKSEAGELNIFDELVGELAAMSTNTISRETAQERAKAILQSPEDVPRISEGIENETDDAEEFLEAAV